MRIVFDTSVLIDGLRQNPIAEALLAYFEKGGDELYISSIVGFELFSGTSSQDTDQQKRIQEFLNFFEIVEVTWKIAKRAGEIYRTGIKDLQIPDYIIAATAFEIGAEVATLNQKHFRQIPGVRIYQSR